MATVEINDSALTRADTFLTAFLTERIPDADFSEGGALRDFMVKAIAFVFAYLDAERQRVRTSQSLLALSREEESEEVADAVNALLGNLLISRAGGRPARARVTLHFSQAVPVVLPLQVRFYKDSAIAFQLDAPSSLSIPSSALTPVYNADGTVRDYTVVVNLRAWDVGTAYNISAGRFLKADAFSPFFTYAENLEDVVDGKNVETSSDMLARSGTAISTRNLVNATSIEAVLRENFPLVERVLSVGFGEPEMLRDRIGAIYTGLPLHIGGKSDIYVKLPVVQTSVTLIPGVPVPRPDGVIATFIDANADFLSGTPVQPGDVLRLTTGQSSAPRNYFITDVISATTLLIDERAGFEEDNVADGTFCEYVIGNLSPTFNNVRTLETTGQASAAYPLPKDTVLLSAGAHLKIRSVEVINTSAGPPVTYDCSEQFFATNTVPTALTHRATVLNPAYAGSNRSMLAIKVNPTGNAADMNTGDWEIVVRYDTVEGYDAISAYVSDPYQRTLNSDDVVKSYLPVYINAAFGYRLARGAENPVEENAVKTALAAWLNGFNLEQTLDVSAVTELLREEYPQIGVLMGPVTLRYEILLPDRQRLEFETSDIVTLYPHDLFPEAPVSGARLVRRNDVDVVNPSGPEIRALYNSLGVSDRVIMYVARAEDFSIVEVT